MDKPRWWWGRRRRAEWAARQRANDAWVAAIRQVSAAFREAAHAGDLDGMRSARDGFRDLARY